MLEGDRLELKGFTVSIRCPSEEQFKVRASVTHLVNKDSFFELVRRLNELLWDITLKYAKEEKRVKGRGNLVKIKGSWTLEFYPIPNRFLNILAYIRRRAYKYLNEYGVTIQEIREGMSIQKLYLLPENLASEFIKKIRELNAEIQELNEKIKDYMKSEDMRNIRRLLKEYNVVLPDKSYGSQEIKVNLLYIQLTTESISELARKMPEIRDELEREKNELVKQAIEDMRVKIMPIVESIQKIRTLKSLEKAKEKLMKIRETCESLGLHALSSSVVTPVITFLEDPSRYPFNEKPTPENIDARIKSLVDSLPI